MSRNAEPHLAEAPPVPAGVPPAPAAVAQARRRLASRLRSFVRGHEILLLPLAIVVGLLAGLAVAVMSWGSQLAHVTLYGLPLDVRLSAGAAVSPMAALVTPTLGGLVLGVMERLRLRWKLPLAVDPVEANALRGGALSLRDSLVVSGQTLISNGCGASVGLEAGYAQIGAGLASQIGRLARLRRNDLRLIVGCGVAGAIGAAFNAPLAGALYACELVVGAYSVRSAGPILAAALSASLLAGRLGGHPYSLHVAAAAEMSATQVSALSGLALVTASAGVGIMHAVAFAERAGKRWLPLALRPALGGACVGLLALATPQVLAAGHGAMALDLGLSLAAPGLLVLLALKTLACVVSLASGFRGGLFFASLFLGVLIGKLYGVMFAGLLAACGVQLDAATCAFAGMAGLATATVGAPLTMVLLVLEMTRSFSAAAAALPVCLLSSLLVRSAFGHSFSTWRLHLQGETIRGADDVGWMRSLTVRAMMRTDVATAPADATIAACRRAFPLGSYPAVFVVDEAGVYQGLALLSDIFGAGSDADMAEASVLAVTRWRDAALAPGMDVRAAMKLFEAAQADLLAVVDGAGRVVGFLTETFARRRFMQELERATSSITQPSAAA